MPLINLNKPPPQTVDRDSSGDVNMIVDDDEDDEADTEPAEVGLNFPAGSQRGVKRDYTVYRVTQRRTNFIVVLRVCVLVCVCVYTVHGGACRGFLLNVHIFLL